MIDEDKFLDDLAYIDPNNNSEIRKLEEKYSPCEIYVDIEKHHQLQYTYYYDIDFYQEEHFFVVIENGINNGTELISAKWGFDSTPNSRTIEVLDDIIFDEEGFELWFSGAEDKKEFVKTKAKFIFESNKKELLKLHKEQSYDNYVTGGGTNKTDNYYSSKHKELKEKGVFYKHIYKEIEVDVNFI